MTTKNRKKRRKVGTRQYLLKLPVEMFSALEARAKKDSTSMAALIRRGIETELFAAGPESISALRDELEAERQSNADYESSFALYDKASRALADAYKQAHPEFPADAWPDATKVNVWAASIIGSGKIATREDVGMSIGRAQAAGTRVGESRWCESRKAVCPKVPQCVHGDACAELPPVVAPSKRKQQIAKTVERAKASIARTEEPCKNCKHPRGKHWTRGCVAGCNCSEKRFR